MRKLKGSTVMLYALDATRAGQPCAGEQHLRGFQLLCQQLQRLRRGNDDPLCAADCQQLVCNHEHCVWLRRHFRGRFCQDRLGTGRKKAEKESDHFSHHTGSSSWTAWLRRPAGRRRERSFLCTILSLSLSSSTSSLRTSLSDTTSRWGEKNVLFCLLFQRLSFSTSV